jgi:hypothetical protein
MAQRDFFRRERGRVHTILWRIVGSNMDMEDLVQDAFMEIFRSMPRFRGESSLATWLDRITVRVAYAHLRRRRAEAVHLSVVPEPLSGDPSAEERAIARETLRRLYRWLARWGGPWGMNALFAEGRLEADRGHADEARRLLREYLTRYPGGPNADDARRVLGHLP